MTEARAIRWLLRITTMLVLAFIYVPLLVVAVYAFNESNIQTWPIAGVSLRWFERALADGSIREAFLNSLLAATGATAIALVLGSMAAFGVNRYRFFGRETISFLVILPIALPGVVTGIALANAFLTMFGIELGLFSLVVSHATFCIVTVFNNAIARLRRLGGNLEEASMDLGAGTFRTFGSVTLPMMRSALLAGALLSFALSFDEIIVTTFTAGTGVQTLPIWIYQNLFRPNQAPVVNVVAAALIVLSIIPIWLSQKLAGTDESVAAAR